MCLQPRHEGPPVVTSSRERHGADSPSEPAEGASRANTCVPTAGSFPWACAQPRRAVSLCQLTVLGPGYPPRRGPAHRCSGSCRQLPHETAGEISLEVPQASFHSPNFGQKKLSSLILQPFSTFQGPGERATANCPQNPQTPNHQLPPPDLLSLGLPTGLQWSLQ